MDDRRSMARTDFPESTPDAEPMSPLPLCGRSAPVVRRDTLCDAQLRQVHNAAIDSKLGGCDLVRLKVSDMMHGRHAVMLAMVVQHETQQPVRFELADQTLDAVEA